MKGLIEIKSDQCKYILNDSRKYFMVFITVADLLDAVYSFYSSKEKSKKIICVDSSFYLEIIRNRDGTAAFYAADTYMGNFEIACIVNEVFNACENFYKKYESKIQVGNPVKNDLENAIKRLGILLSNKTFQAVQKAQTTPMKHSQ